MKKTNKILISVGVIVILLGGVFLIYSNYYKYDVCLTYTNQEVIYSVGGLYNFINNLNHGGNIIETKRTNCFNFYEDASYYQWYIENRVLSLEEAKVVLHNPSLKQKVILSESNFTKLHLAYQILQTNNISLEIRDEAKIVLVNSIVIIKKINNTSNESENYVLDITKRDFPYFKQKTLQAEI